MATSSDILLNGQVSRDIPTARQINSLLNASKTRLEGLNMLNLFLPKCPDGDFIQFCNSWMENCCKTDALTKNRDLAVRLLDKLFKISSNYQELKKSVSFFITTRYFDFFFKYFLNSQPGWSCTQTCLSLYRGACSPFQEELEKHLRNELDRKVKISSTLAGCFALIPCVGGGGNEGLVYKKNWKAQFVKLLSVCHSVLNDLFVNVEDSQALLQECETFESTHDKLSAEREKEIEFLVIQLYNHSAVLNSMLLNQYPAPKSVPSDQIFELVCRGLAINPKALTTRQTTGVLSLQKVLPEVHRILFSLLKAVIVSCKNQLLPYSHLICKLIKQSLEWTASESNHGCEKPFGGLRIAVYETLSNWLAVARNGSCVETISGVVLSNAVSDIESKKEVVFLKGAKAQKQFKNREQTIRWIDPTANSGLCCAALKALQFLLKFGGVSLKPEEHKFLQEFAVKLLAEVQKSSTFDLVVPFSMPSCRLELYSLLLDLVHQPCPKWPPPTSFVLRLFSNGINDSSPAVSAFCSSALNLTTIIIHPQYYNGGFPPCEMSNDRPLPEIELQVRDKSMEVEIEKETETIREETLESQELSSPGEKISDMSEESNVSWNDDSANTITFSKDTPEPKKSTSGEETSGKSSPTPTDAEPCSKKQKTTEEPEKEKLPSVKGSPENSSVIKPRNPKSVSSESIDEDEQPKTRYFLRSKRKGSSEEPDEWIKRTNSLESIKSTPGKSTTKATPNGKKRPKTRGSSKIKIRGETENITPEKNNHDDDDDDDDDDDEEEDIKAAFDDSFVD